MSACAAPTKTYRLFDPFSSSVAVHGERSIFAARQHGRTTMRLADNRVNSVLDLYQEELRALYGAGEVRAITTMVFEHALGWPASDLAMRRSETLSESELLKVYLPLKRLRTGEPVQYVLGEAWFMGMRLKVDSNVLIPRPETEELIEQVVAAFPVAPRHVLDAGTGSGCIALALKRKFPSAHVIGVDLSQGALSVAQANSLALGVDVEWRNADVLHPAFAQAIGALDLLVSNPPYVPQEEAPALSRNVFDHEPHTALFVPNDDPLLFYRTIARHGLSLLAPGGQLWFEVHHLHGAEVAPLLEGMGYASSRSARDLSGNIRFVNAVR